MTIETKINTLEKQILKLRQSNCPNAENDIKILKEIIKQLKQENNS